jgi:hypothetical protein
MTEKAFVNSETKLCKFLKMDTKLYERQRGRAPREKD